jgi:hypothetical protein
VTTGEPDAWKSGPSGSGRGRRKSTRATGTSSAAYFTLRGDRCSNAAVLPDERWFGFLADQMIRRGAHKNVQVLEADIRKWVKNWNEDPKPFIWTKTAEEILDSLARFCRRISGAGHQVGGDQWLPLSSPLSVSWILALGLLRPMISTLLPRCSYLVVTASRAATEEASQMWAEVRSTTTLSGSVA